MSDSGEKSRPILEVRHLVKRFGGLVATDDLSFTLGQGEVLGLIGPNGAGKTTVLAQLSGELYPDQGDILFQGRNITGLNMPARANVGIVRSFQITAVFERFTVLENACLAVQARAKHHFHFWRNALKDRELLDPAYAVLEEVALASLAHRRVSELAHGQKRQLEIAMALATDPLVLLLDEPMAGAGKGESDVIVELLETLRSDHAIVLVEHDMNVVFRLADRILVLDEGSVLASGAPDAVRANAKVQSAYLSEGD